MNQIDLLTHSEFAGGDSIFESDGEQQDEQEIHNDGVDLSVNGSDDKFPDESPNEQGEIVSSDEDKVQVRQRSKLKVASKVVRVSSTQKQDDTVDDRSDHFSKFLHLRHDPDYKDFVSEILDESEKKKGKHTSSGSRPNKGGVYSPENIIGRPHRSPIMKSPSDTTIYSPALRRVNKDDVALIEKISKFVESIRIDKRNSNSRTERDLSGHRSLLDTPPSRDRHRIERYEHDNQGDVGSKPRVKTMCVVVKLQDEGTNHVIDPKTGRMQTE